MHRVFESQDLVTTIIDRYIDICRGELWIDPESARFIIAIRHITPQGVA